jgi:hypothetical protein
MRICGIFSSGGNVADLPPDKRKIAREEQDDCTALLDTDKRTVGNERLGERIKVRSSV